MRRIGSLGAGGRVRSLCPLSLSLDMLGDRWSLLIVRDLMVRGYRRFGEFHRSGEGIATNVLADRLRRLERNGLVMTDPEAADARLVNYRLTAKGIDLAPVLLELLLWAARHEATGLSPALIRAIEHDRDAFLEEVRRRWRERDTAPLIPHEAGRARPAKRLRRGRGAAGNPRRARTRAATGGRARPRRKIGKGGV